MKPMVKKVIPSKVKPKSKSSSHPSHKVTSDHSSGNDASTSSSKEKTNYKNYAGLSSRSVRTIWEQHDKHESEIHPEVFNKLAEDTTYKIWELANNIKTYARHSSGRVTYDLVNDILKDSNVPPIIGANDGPWDKIEYDGVCFFNSDEVLDLREEYIKDVNIEQCNTLALSTSWMAESSMADDLIDMYNNICDVIYVGDEKCFEEAINILINNPHIASLLKLFISKSIEMLAFEYTEDTLKRSLKFLSALTRNFHASHSDLTLELSLLCQIFVNLLLGQIQPKFITTADDFKMEIDQNNMGNMNNGMTNHIDSQQSQNMGTISPIFNNSLSIPMMANNFASEDSNNSDSNTTAELLRSIENIKQEPDSIDISNIKDEYEALFSMVQVLGIKREMGNELNNSIGSQIKDEYENLENGNQNYLEQQQPQSVPIQQNGIEYESKTETEHEDENVSILLSETSTIIDTETNNNAATQDNENITTIICNDSMVDDVCQTIGLCCSKWGFVEQECTYLIVERLQKYFADKKFVQIDYSWITRVARGLWSIGEFAFRELSIFFEFIDILKVPEAIQPYFNCSAIYLRGRSDIFLYEYLNELCGDGLLPFMFHYYDALEKLSLKHFHRGKALINEHSYKIVPKVALRLALKTPAKLRQNNYMDVFPDHEKFIKKKKAPKFGFRFAGCRPVNVKSKKIKQPIPIIDATKQNNELLANYNRKLVIARRRLLKPDTNHVRVSTFSNYRNLQL